MTALAIVLLVLIVLWLALYVVGQIVDDDVEPILFALWLFFGAGMIAVAVALAIVVLAGGAS